ncbi:hypothetical protein ILYODFUR_023937 [Ilyodon furcidens]|uniref:Secreted protein n=1 Tax=Ilyodon furcidens TaxID=33524 RepID=A0ABV0UMM5_9TELE
MSAGIMQKTFLSLRLLLTLRPFPPRETESRRVHYRKCLVRTSELTYLETVNPVPSSRLSGAARAGCPPRLAFIRPPRSVASLTEQHSSACVVGLCPTGSHGERNIHANMRVCKHGVRKCRLLRREGSLKRLEEDLTSTDTGVV